MRAAGFGRLELSLASRSSEISRVHEALDEIAVQAGLPARSLAHLHLALEEHLANVISHGYNPGQTGTIRVRFVPEASMLRIEIEDDARPFNPLEAPEVDTSLPIDDRPLGGLGVHFIRKCVDELQYERAGARNVLTMKKRLG